jgi:hypothetical protein
MARTAPVPVSGKYTLPAPVGGWDAVSALADMPEDRAVVLENFFPEPGLIRMRKGFSSNVTGMSGAVESLLVWTGPTSAKMFAANGTSIYDASSSGAVGAASLSGLTNARWQQTNMLTSGGSYLVMCNGADSVRNYDGSSWTTPTITASGTSSAAFINVNVFKQRLYFIEKNTLKAWYLPASSISGTANPLDFTGIFKMGGYLVAMGTISIDGGNGPDDYAAFLTSEGEVAVYQGTDPSSSTTWAIVGRYQIGRPIGRRCLIQVGGDLGVITEDGFVPLSVAIRLERAQQQTVSISQNIRNAVQEAVRLYKGNFGWEAIGYPLGGYALFNIPKAENSVAEQYVMNIATKAWCKFTGMNANCWALYNGRLYFGANDGKVYLADDGFSDAGSDRPANVKTAFTYCGQRGRIKQFKMARALVASDGVVTPALEINTDFADLYPTASPSAGASSGPFWDQEYWDMAYWGSASEVQTKYTAVRGNGDCAAIRWRANDSAADITISAFDLLYEPGGLVG